MEAEIQIPFVFRFVIILLLTFIGVFKGSLATFSMRNEILPAVSAIILNEKGEVLLQRRADTKKWCIISGHVEFGESVEQAIIREVMEETNTCGEVVRLIGVYSSPLYTTYYYPDRTVQYVVNYFEVKLEGEIQPGLTNRESEEFAYFPVDNLPLEIDLINPYWLSDALSKDAFGFIR